LEYLKIGNFILKNRMECTNSLPYYLQGPEKYPSESVLTHYINKAQNGAAIVTVRGINCYGIEQMRGKMMFEERVSHYPAFDIFEPSGQNYLVQLTEAIHYYNAIPAMSLIFLGPAKFPLVETHQGKNTLRWIDSHDAVEAFTYEELSEIADSYAQQAKMINGLGFDMLSIHMAYRGPLVSKFLSPLTNHRNDEFGGSLENRARFPLMILERVKKAIGNKMLIELVVSGEEPEGGYTLDDLVKFLKMSEPYVDIVQPRAGEIDPAHPIGYTLEPTPFLRYAEYVKKSGVDMKVSAIGGFQDVEQSEEALSSGKVDIIGMARAWLSNPNYGRLVQSGNSEDVVPCIRCNKCHGRGNTDPHASVCSVNPLIGLEHHAFQLGTPPVKKKSVAIIGGGPGGMKAAMDLFDRGHEVTLFEKSDALGGNIKHSDIVPFKWPLRSLKDYFIRQVAKRDIKVFLNTDATPKMLCEMGFDAVVSALGSVPVIPPIPGAKAKNVMTALEAFDSADSVGKKVVVIGGGEVGIEVGIFLAQKGVDATVLEMRDTLAADSPVQHYRSMMVKAWETQEHFSSVVNACCTGIDSDGVRYADKDGIEHKIECDTVVLSAGMKAMTDEALTFEKCANEFYIIGDCRQPGNIQTTIRSAYATASTI